MFDGGRSCSTRIAIDISASRGFGRCFGISDVSLMLTAGHRSQQIRSIDFTSAGLAQSVELAVRGKRRRYGFKSRGSTGGQDDLPASFRALADRLSYVTRKYFSTDESRV